HLYSCPGENDKFVPVFFETKDAACIPMPLSDVTRIDLSQADGFKRLCCRLLGIPPAEKPPIRMSLAPVSLADGFFSRSNSTGARLEQRPFGLRDEKETLFSNMFRVSTPAYIQTAKVSLRRNIQVRDFFSAIWVKSGGVTDPPVDYWIENGMLYTFRSF